MIKVSKLADYGMVLLTYMAGKEVDCSYTARDLSSVSGLPLPMVSKVLKLLAREDVLDSHRGVKGGYSLSRKPEAISANDIIAALDGPVALTSCLDSSSACGIAPQCSMRNHWELINESIIDSLEQVSLADMCKPHVLDGDCSQEQSNTD